MAINNISEAYILAQSAGVTYNGDGSDQTYSINPFIIEPGETITIIDQGGSNTIELPAGLTIASSLVIADQTILTLSNGAEIDIRGADTFTYQVGQNAAAGDGTGAELGYADFTQDILGVSIPSGGLVAQGGSSVINDDGSADVGAPVPTYALTPLDAVIEEGNAASFSLETSGVAEGTEISYTISGVSEADIGGPLTGTTTVLSFGGALIQIPVLADELTEGTETLTVTLEGGLASADVTVLDTSTDATGNYISGYGGNGVFSNFNIEVIFETAVTASQRAAFVTAADYLSSLIVGDVSDDGIIDDISITASIEWIDGEYGILGQAGPSYIRPYSYLPSEGEMIFDIADIGREEAEGTFIDTVLHEMLHVMGFGTVWDFMGLVDYSSYDWRFEGDNAIAAYNSEFSGIASSDPYSLIGVPVEMNYGPGTAGGHWDEETFFDETMTGFSSSAAFMSAMTVAALEDMGYDTIYDIGAPNAVMPQLYDFAGAFDLSLFESSDVDNTVRYDDLATVPDFSGIPLADDPLEMALVGVGTSGVAETGYAA
ncbi:leishmanolysin [Marivita sp. GX14005]|uniref:leishmanolysin n=1 Tax=Marivita sp. GX14005 TaxID=2942276 RepID=UPI002019F475|nr:leishmanolysin [Marivita sp. GX14005]MCL3883932.1 leishmanolysin [Marivita sp. GX14005]